MQLMSRMRVACLLLLAGETAWAGEARDGWYVLPSFHQAGVEKANMKYRQGTTEIKFDTTFGDDTGAGLAVGYAFEAPYRVDVEYQRQSNDLKVPGGNPFNGSSLKSTTVAVDVWRDFAPWHRLRPYVGIGIGAGKLELNDLDTNFVLGRLGAGFEWYFHSMSATDTSSQPPTRNCPATRRS
jgi:opacity protein-like surface antigen